MKILYPTVIIIVLLVSAGTLFAQSGEREKGIELYNKGDYSGAAESLQKAVTQNGRDVIALYYSGLAAEKQNQPKEAVKNYQSAVEVCLKLLENEVEKNLSKLRANPGKPPREFLAKDLAAEMKAAIESGQRFAALNQSKAASEDWQTMVLTLETLDPNAPQSINPDSPKTAPTPVRIISKPKADYPDQAKRKFTTGSIRLYILFLSNGRIGLAVPFNRLPDGLTESAISAAKGIKFEPATKDEKQVSVFKQVEYGFRAL
jgi:tetratricopeptide (TPR) repeat protein